MSGSQASGTIVVIGGGRMGEALVAGLISSGRSVAVVEKDEARREQLTTTHPNISVLPSVEAVGEALGSDFHVVLAVKPADVESVCRELSDLPDLSGRRILSIAAGVTLDALERNLDGAAVVRAMPNTPALVGAGASAIAPGRHAGSEDVAWARETLQAVGTVVELPEQALDAVTGLSGSGPAYVFLIAEALVDAGVLVGLSRSVASDLVVQTLLGSARMLAETGEEPASLRAAVTSPGGTTAAGLRAL